MNYNDRGRQDFSTLKPLIVVKTGKAGFVKTKPAFPGERREEIKHYYQCIIHAKNANKQYVRELNNIQQKAASHGTQTIKLFILHRTTYLFHSQKQCATQLIF